MAEGFAWKWGKDVLHPWSAGSRPSGKINPTAIQVMNEIGVNLELQSSKNLSELPKIKWDTVITMGCADACPFVSSKSKEDWDIPDPKELPLHEFRRVRDLIETKVRSLIGRIKAEESSLTS